MSEKQQNALSNSFYNKQFPDKCNFTMVIVTHTGIDPWTMMIHLHDTSVTSPTVMGPRSFESLTLRTILELVAGLDVVRGPVEG